MADSVQWLSQSDYSICISVVVEFYLLVIVDEHPAQVNYHVQKSRPNSLIVLVEQSSSHSNVFF